MRPRKEERQYYGSGLEVGGGEDARIEGLLREHIPQKGDVVGHTCTNITVNRPTIFCPNL
jgi:hypothetical protein